MKILITYLTYGVDIFGGVERSLYTFVKGLEALSHDVVVYTGEYCLLHDGKRLDNVHYSPYLKNDFSDPLDVIDERIRCSYQDNINVLQMEFKLLMTDYSPDYILAVDHLWGILPYLDIWDSIKCPTGIVFHMSHNPPLISLVANLPFRDYFSVSKFIDEELLRVCDDIGQIELYPLPNSIVCSDYMDKFERKEDVIFCNSRMTEGKGIHILLEAFWRLYTSNNNLKLLLCGGGFHFGDNQQIYNYTSAFVKKHKLENAVTILPALSWDEIPCIVCQATCVVLPTIYESFGIAALESLAAATPLVCTNAGNLPYLTQSASFQVPYGSVDELEIALSVALGNSQDVKTKKKMGQEIAMKYDYLLVAKNFIDYIMRG